MVLHFILDFCRTDDFASSVNDFLGSARHKQPTISIDVTDITSLEPSICEGLSRGLIITFVPDVGVGYVKPNPSSDHGFGVQPFKHWCSLDDDLSRLVARQQVACIAHDRQLGPECLAGGPWPLQSIR